MPRRKIFYAANQISEAQYAKAGEFVDNETLEPYEGVYCIADETFLTGATPSLESRVLREATGVFGKKFEDILAGDFLHQRLIELGLIKK